MYSSVLLAECFYIPATQRKRRKPVVTIRVEDNNIESAIKKLRNKTVKERIGVMLRLREENPKKSDWKKQKRKLALKRYRKAQQ